MMDADVIVVGGGVIGTAIAWRAAVAGRTVTLIDPGTDDKASLVAAGMLGPVVHRQQRAVPSAGGGEHLEQRELFARLEALLPQLHDVHPAAEDRVEEPGQVALGTPPVRAQVKAGVG